MSEPVKVNLGCGQYPKEGFVNVDFDEWLKPDVVHNLDAFPYPFEDSSIDHLEADHVLEHLSDPYAVMKELHRIMKPGGSVIIKVPHFSRGFTHWDHKRGFDASFPYYFKQTYPGFLGFEFPTTKVRFRWFAQPYFKKQIMPLPIFWIGNTLGTVIDIFANLSHFFCSRVWCYWVGGFEEIEFNFLCKK